MALSLGTVFEHSVSVALGRVRILLRHSGGANDRGVDLRGTWLLPRLAPHTASASASAATAASMGTRAPIPETAVPVVVQCKVCGGVFVRADHIP